MPRPDDEGPGLVEAVAAAIAGPAFAGSALFLRRATLLPPEIFDATAAVLATWGLSPLLHRRRGRAAATLLRGAGLALGVALLAGSLVPPFDRAVIPVLLLVVAGTLLQAHARLPRPQPALFLGGFALLAAAWGAAFWGAPLLPEPVRLRVAIVLGGAATLAGLLWRRHALRRGWRVLAPTPVGVLLVAKLGASYLSYRGLVAAHLANLPLYEWTLGVGLSTLLLTRLRRQAREHEVPEPWESEARRHAQDVAPLYDERMAPLASAIQRYLRSGEGFDAYRDALARAHGAPPAYHEALAALQPVPQPRRRMQRAEAERARLAAHERLVSTLNEHRGNLHGPAPSRLPAHP